MAAAATGDMGLRLFAAGGLAAGGAAAIVATAAR